MQNSLTLLMENVLLIPPQLMHSHADCVSSKCVSVCVAVWVFWPRLDLDYRDGEVPH